jgi:hypothetical protein
MNNMTKIIFILLLTFVPAKASDEYKVVCGLWDIKIYDGKWVIFNIKEKECCFKFTEDGTDFKFLSSYSIVAKLKKENEK